jgi:hypothetical protein
MPVVRPLAPRTTANLPEKPLNSLETILANRVKQAARPTMGQLPSEMMQKDKLKLDIFNAVEEEDEDTHFAVVTQPKLVVPPPTATPV